MSELFFFVILAIDGEIKSCDVFDDEGQAIGYAQSRFEENHPIHDDAVVFAFDPEQKVAIPIYYVDMKENIEIDEDFEDDEEFAISRRKKISKPKLSEKYGLVDVYTEYDKKQLPSKQKLSRIKEGNIVQIALSTPDSYENVWVKINKVLERKNRSCYDGILLEIPKTFVPPSNMKINFYIENILAVE